MTTTKLIIELGDCSTIDMVIFKFSNHPLHEIILGNSTWCDVWMRNLLAGKGELGGGTREKGWVLTNKVQYEIFTDLKMDGERYGVKVDELPDDFSGYVRKLYVYNITFTLVCDARKSSLTVELPHDFHRWMKKFAEFHNKVYGDDTGDYSGDIRQIADELGVEIIQKTPG